MLGRFDDESKSKILELGRRGVGRERGRKYGRKYITISGIPRPREGKP